jgi:beta-lactamase class A
MDATRFDRINNVFAQRLSRRQALVGAGGGLVATGLAMSGRQLIAAAQETAATPAAATTPMWEEIDRLFAAAAPNTALLAAELTGGSWRPIHALNADAILPVGSSFKLWVLGALALEIQAGRIAWEQPVEIKDLYRSVPGGDLRYALPGARYTVRYLAERMIQKSDNTATDHVFYLVGREKIEAAMTAMGHSDPALNIPILSTRELALLKFGYSTAELNDFYALPVEERRRVLDEDLAQKGVDSLPDIDQTAPLEIDRVEWFATRKDLCNTMNWLDLKTMEAGMMAVSEVMALETQLPFDGEVWPYAGFKGGSELGVLSGTWLLHRADTRHFVYSVGFKNPDGPIDIAAATAAMEAGRDRLALAP